MNLEQLANEFVAVITVDDLVDLAIRHMWQLNIRHLTVVRKNVPVGMVSDRDVLFYVCWLDQTKTSLSGDRASPASVGNSDIDRRAASCADRSRQLSDVGLGKRTEIPAPSLESS
jgi:CBS domain-containing protein